MLAPRRPAGAELGAHGQRHRGVAAGHERHLRRLVEQLVEAHADEVEVHDLDDRRIPAIAAPTPRPMIAVSEIGVSRTRSPNLSWSPRISPNTLPPSADVDAGDEHLGVVRQLDLERVVDRIHHAEHRRVGGRRGGFGMRRAFAQRRSRASVATSGAADARAVATASSSSRVDRSPPASPSSRGVDAERLEPPALDDRAGRAPSTRRARCRSGSAADRLRSGRASGTWSPRRSSGRAAAHGVDHPRHRRRPRRPRRCRRPRRSRRRTRRPALERRRMLVAAGENSA